MQNHKQQTAYVKIIRSSHMKTVATILTIILIGSLTAIGQEIPLPENYSVIDTVWGDLDKDGINELVVAYNTQKTKDIYENVSRELIIYKKEKNQWMVWQKSEQSLYDSRGGGTMGDPLGEIKIKNGILLINQRGGSSWKWEHTDKYRFQNGEFYLIGYTSISGRDCEYWEKVYFNLLSGKIIFKKEYEDCETLEQEIYKRENEMFYKKGISISLKNRLEKDIKIVSPKFGHEIYL